MAADWSGLISVVVGYTVYGRPVVRYFDDLSHLRRAAAFWRDRTLGGTSQNGLSEADWQEAQAIMQAAATIIDE